MRWRKSQYDLKLSSPTHRSSKKFMCWIYLIFATQDKNCLSECPCQNTLYWLVKNMETARLWTLCSLHMLFRFAKSVLYSTTAGRLLCYPTRIYHWHQHRCIYKGKKTFYMLKYYIWLDNLLNDKIAEDRDGQIKKRLSPFQMFISTKDAFEKLQIVYFP